MFEFTQFESLAVIFLTMVIGEWTAKVSKGKIPGILVMTILLIAGFWIGLPADIGARTGISGEVFTISVMLLVTHLGTTISRREMIAQWQTVLIGLIGVAAICLASLTLGAFIFGWRNSVCATPVLSGALVAATIMREAALAKGDTVAAVVALITMVMQGLAGYPLAAFCLSREAKRLKALHEAGHLQSIHETESSAGEGRKERHDGTNVILFKLIVISLISIYIEKFTGGHLSKYVCCLVLGFVAHEFGFIEKDALSAAKSDGILMSFLVAGTIASLSYVTPEVFLPVAGITLGLVVLGAAAMALAAFGYSKVTKSSFYMAFAIMLNSYFGFPINVMLTNEAIDACSDDPEVKAALNAQIMPKMLVGGFVCVTIVSVLVAGILVKFL